MPELALKVGAGAHYLDGDILCAFNSRRIRCTHAQHICHVKNAGGGKGVLRDNAHVARDYFEHTAQYRFERVSRTEIKTITLATLDEAIIDGTRKMINGKMQHMDVPLYVALRLAYDGHRIFGSSGAEIWYGGNTDVSDAKLDLVWNAIETKTAFREVDFPLWPAGSKDLISHLFVTVDDFNEATASDLVAQETEIINPGTDDEAVKIIKKRRQHIDWRDHIAAKEHDDIEDKIVSVDLRETMTPLVRDDTVKTKALAIS